MWIREVKLDGGSEPSVWELNEIGISTDKLAIRQCVRFPDLC